MQRSSRKERAIEEKNIVCVMARLDGFFAELQTFAFVVLVSGQISSLGAEFTDPFLQQ